MKTKKTQKAEGSRTILFANHFATALLVWSFFRFNSGGMAFYEKKYGKNIKPSSCVIQMPS